jgi:hypothetical protein
MTDKSGEDRFRHRSEDGVSDAEVEGHRFRHGPAEQVDEAERMRNRSDEDAPDVEGHRFRPAPVDRART